MANLWGFLLLASWPLVKKVLISLGIGVLTYGGLTLIGNQIQAQVLTNWGALPVSLVQVASLLGMPQALGIILGGLSARIALVSVGRIGKVTS